MPEKKSEPAWSDQADAVYIAAISMIDEMKGYGERANLILNLLRYVTMTEVAESIGKVVGTVDMHVFVESTILVNGMQHLVDDFAEEAKKMPRRMNEVMTAEHGCGACPRCKAAAKAAYADDKVVIRPSKQSREAIDAIINTITGGKPRNPDN